MIVNSGMQRSESLPGAWSPQCSDTMRKSVRENRKNLCPRRAPHKSHAHHLLEAFTRRGRNEGYGEFNEQVKQHSKSPSSSDVAKQAQGTETTTQPDVTLKKDVELQNERTRPRLFSKASEATGCKDTGVRSVRSPAGKPDDKLEREQESDEQIYTAPPKQEKPEKVSEAVLARKLNMPFDILKEACAIFKKYSDYEAGVGGEERDIGQARLDMNDFVKVVCDLCEVSSADQLSPDYLDETFRTADRDCSGFIDVEEFCLWHASASFAEEMVISEKDQQIRDISRKVQIPIVDIERFWTNFCKFDEDGSGNIEYEEFTELLHVLMKVPKGHVLPKERVQSLWRQADADGSGEINFHEFVVFYIQRFGYDPNNSEFDFASFYKIGR